MPPDRGTAIRLENVTVRYRVPHERIHTFKEFAIRFLRRQLKMAEHLAIQDVDMDVRKGEMVGIVGANGAGKSTLLKLTARVLQPTGGRVWVKGRVAPLLDISGSDSESRWGGAQAERNRRLLRPWCEAGLARGAVSRTFRE